MKSDECSVETNELRIPAGKRADTAVISANGAVIIFEVPTPVVF